MAEHPTDAQVSDAARAWRVGRKVPLNVYEGDRPVCQCHSAEDATRIVAACNAAPGLVERVRDRQRLFDLVRFCRHKLLEENLITEEEFSRILIEGSGEGGSVSRLQSYDEQRAENARLTQKVAELEAENARLREALERIFLMDKCPSPGDGCSQCIARAALAPAPKEDHA